MLHGFLRVAAATPLCTVGNCGENTAAILALIHEGASCGASVIVFPELSITGYTCGDLFSQELLSRLAVASVRLIAEKTREIAITSIVGFPFSWGSSRYNCAAVISRGSILGIIPKTHIPNYGEFYEIRHFAPAPTETLLIPAGVFGSEPVPFGTDVLFTDEKNNDISFSVEICEDLWVPSPPSSRHAQEGALVIANLSASNEVIGKAEYRRSLISGQSGRCVCAYVYADAGQGESSTDMVFSGHNMIAENGSIIAESSLFSSGLIYTDIDTEKLLQERRRLNTFANSNFYGKKEYRRVPVLLDIGTPSMYLPVGIENNQTQKDVRPSLPLKRHIDPHPFVPAETSELSHRCEEVLSIQTSGLVKRLSHTGISSAVIGISGGLDSTLALLVTVRAFDILHLSRTGILAITMPGFGTTKKTRSNALKLASLLGLTTEEIKINKAVTQHFSDIKHDIKNLDITYENSQARERTQILMDKANQKNALVIGTGDLSELALGWATYNGDHMSMYGVNSSIPKTLVRHLVHYCAMTHTIMNDTVTQKQFTSVLLSILATPVSPELLPPENGKIAQKTEHIVGPYELHDFFLYYLTRWGFSPSKILYLAENAFGTQRNSNEKEYTVYSREEILMWMTVFYRRFFSQQFKRSCLPDGPKVGSVSLSPRSDWRMPSDASAAIWLKELESLQDIKLD